MRIIEIEKCKECPHLIFYPEKMSGYNFRCGKSNEFMEWESPHEKVLPTCPLKEINNDNTFCKYWREYCLVNGKAAPEIQHTTQGLVAPVVSPPTTQILKSCTLCGRELNSLGVCPNCIS